MTSLLVLAALASPQEELDFRPVYKANQKLAYTFVHEIMGMKTPTECEATVKSVQGDLATIYYKWVNTSSNGTKKSTQELTTAVGLMNLPNSAANGIEVGAIQLAVVGITPGVKVKPGSEVKVSWTNDSKNMTVEGKGKVGSVNKEAKTVPVDWELNLTVPGYTRPAVIKQKTIYSTDDFSMVQSEGSTFIEQFSMTIKFTAIKKVR